MSVAVAPFALFCLPRSRSAWLARWLSAAAQAPVGHDLAIEADSVDAYLECLYRRVRGVVETGAAEAAPLIRASIPSCRIAVVLRDVADVAASLSAFVQPNLEELTARYEALAWLAGEPGVFACRYEELADPRVCARLQEHLLVQPFSWPAWRALEGVRHVIDFPARLALLDQRRAAIADLKAELADRLAEPRPWASVGEEAWQDVEAGVIELGKRHHAEATGGREGDYSPDVDPVMAAARAGVWRAIVARVDGVMGGYCLWAAMANYESAQPPTMTMGPFYVAPEYGSLRLGPRLLIASRRVFAAEGIETARLHHTTLGRGSKLGLLYATLGAVEHQREFLWTIRE